jgi:hypothetical protein
VPAIATLIFEFAINVRSKLEGEVGGCTDRRLPSRYINGGLQCLFFFGHWIAVYESFVDWPVENAALR